MLILYKNDRDVRFVLFTKTSLVYQKGCSAVGLVNTVLQQAKRAYGITFCYFHLLGKWNFLASYHSFSDMGKYSEGREYSTFCCDISVGHYA